MVFLGNSTMLHPLKQVYASKYNATKYKNQNSV